MFTKLKIGLSLALVLATASAATAAARHPVVSTQQRCTQRWCGSFLRVAT